MNWNLTENGAPLVSGNYLIAALYDPAAPTVVVQSVVLPMPYTSTKNFSFTGLAEQIWNFILWENSTPTVGGASRNSFSLQPTENTTVVRADLDLKAGLSINFAVGGTSYVADTPNDLTGWQYSIERKPQGTQFPGETVAIDTNGFHLLLSGDVFGPDEEWVLHFLPQTAVTAPPAAPSGIVVVPQLITADITLDNTFTGKLGIIEGAASHLTITLPLTGTMSTYKVIGFESAGGSHLAAILQCAGSDTILWSSGSLGSVSQVVLGQNEQIQLFKYAPGVWKILWVSDTVRMTGEIYYDYTTAKLNSTLADGGVRDWNDFAGLRNYVKSLPTSMVVLESAWNHVTTINGINYFDNQAKYTLGDNATFFRVPLLYNIGFLRAVNGSSRYPGDFQVLSVGSHRHNNGVADDKPAGDADNVFPYGQTSADLPGLARGNVGNSSGGTLYQGLTSLTGGAENIPSNTGVYALIRT